MNLYSGRKGRFTAAASWPSASQNPPPRKKKKKKLNGISNCPSPPVVHLPSCRERLASVPWTIRLQKVILPKMRPLGIAVFFTNITSMLLYHLPRFSQSQYALADLFCPQHSPVVSRQDAPHVCRMDRSRRNKAAQQQRVRLGDAHGRAFQRDWHLPHWLRSRDDSSQRPRLLGALVQRHGRPQSGTDGMGRDPYGAWNLHGSAFFRLLPPWRPSAPPRAIGRCQDEGSSWLHVDWSRVPDAWVFVRLPTCSHERKSMLCFFPTPQTTYP
jgi:hypothetical protein